MQGAWQENRKQNTENFHTLLARYQELTASDLLVFLVPALISRRLSRPWTRGEMLT